MENAQKRVVIEKEKSGLGLKEIILVGVLLAAGAVLKFFVGPFLAFGGMKPNFIISMYCLAIMLIKPKFHEAAIIGLLAGITCQFFPGTPWLNLASEFIGASAMCLLIRIPMKAGKVDLRPFVCTALSTVLSGATFLSMLYLLLKHSGAQSLAILAGQICFTSVTNGIIASVLYAPLNLAVNREK